MKRWQSLLAGFAVCLIGMGCAGSAEALSISGRSSSEIEWYDNADGDTAVPAYEYLLLNVKDIDGAGLNFKGYGRFADDLADESDVEGRLYHAYLEKNDLLPHLDVKLGRQFISNAAGTSVMDGLQLKARDLGPFTLTLFGGGDVAYYSDYEAKDLIDGISLNGLFLDKNLDVGLSYTQKWDENELSHELAGLTLDWNLRETLRLYGDTQYNLLSGGVSYFNGGAIYHENDDWSLRADYLYSLPVFSSTSIYSVFAVTEYQEASAEASFRMNDGYRTFARYVYEMYAEGYDDTNVVEAGVEKIRTDRFSGYLSGVLREGEMYGVKARLACLINKSLQAGVGAHLDIIERRVDVETDDDYTTSSRVWADATAFLSKTVNLEAKVERAQSDLWDEFYRGRVRLNILF